jgi:MoxR-like ATPase
VSTPREVHIKFVTTREELNASLIERGEEIDIGLTALVAGENPLFVGPPGTAKSLLLDSIMRWMGGKKFTLLMTKFTQPEEIFGPISLKGLKEERYVRVTAGKLPEADGAFLDEIFKASPAILNTTLRILNEHVFDRGDGTLVKVPLKVCFAGSNEYPQSQDGGKELQALFDRFVLRKNVRPIITQEGRKRLLWGGDLTPRISTSLSDDDLAIARRQAAAVSWSEDSKECLEAILRELQKEGIQPGDRRQKKAEGVARAFAWLHGCEEVMTDHMEILQHVLWDDPIEQPVKAAAVIAKIASPAGMVVNQLLVEAEQVMAGADLKNLAAAATVSAKLGEIHKKLGSVKANGRAEKARTYIASQIKRIKLASLEAL